MKVWHLCLFCFRHESVWEQASTIFLPTTERPSMKDSNFQEAKTVKTERNRKTCFYITEVHPV